MGSEYEDSYSNMPRKAAQKCQHSPQMKHKLLTLILIVATNLLTIYILTGPHSKCQYYPTPTPTIPISTSQPLLDELNATRSQLTHLQTELNSARALLTQLTQLAQLPTQDHLLSDEAKLSLGPHKLPFGHNPRMGSDQIYFSVGSGCLKPALAHDLNKYMSYQIGRDCPSDDALSQSLMLRGCEPLPRRRCHPKSPQNYTEPDPLPASLWATPPDTSIVWDPYTCKNYTCLINRRNGPGSYDCKDCFYLQGRERVRWLRDNGGLDFGIDRVLATKPKGTIRIGLDIGGGSGSFAARMMERNVTIVTTSMNFDGPFNSFISSRGLISMHVTVSERLPFFENTLDIVHSMHVISNWIPDVMMEFILYDVYRVLRPGGIFWLDRFFCFGSQLNGTYVPMFERVGFRTLRWNTGMKFDRGVDKDEWYFSALFEKPMS
ncbi:S-adenosyl-L-methionine-dependentmethyltransferases superfamily protein [Striga asiatica]|uniref:S-adenosyl-L-methionine-dependentmethyltransferases superfamily protein n=1 Tax=Striga asiatica TaxID=4170 RepID=A0A5A7Q1C9_STRAF|nr:S-adenosyl-L-methionine-dependentmethyltransferases superfamily protein [Striga asiatica]